MTNEQILEDALRRVLQAGRLDVAKEIAAEVLDEEVEEHIDDEGFENLDFIDEAEESLQSSSLDFEEYPI